MKTKFMKVLSALLAMALLATTGIGALAAVTPAVPGDLVEVVEDVVKVNAGEPISVSIVAKKDLALNAFDGKWGWAEGLSFTGMTSSVMELPAEAGKNQQIDGNYWTADGELIWVDTNFPTAVNATAGTNVLTATFATTEDLKAGNYRVTFQLEVLGDGMTLFDDEYTLEWSVHVHNDQDNDHMCDACEAEMSKHDWKQTGIKDNGDGTHTVSYTCELNASHTMSDEPEEHTYDQEDGTKCRCGAEKPVTNVAVVNEADVEYEVEGQTITVYCDIACKVGYWDEDEGLYIALEATEIADGCYSFTAPEGVTEVLLVIKGDVNSDGEVDNQDATMTKSVYLELEDRNGDVYTFTAEQMFAADVSDDDEIDNQDVTMIKSVYLELDGCVFEW